VTRKKEDIREEKHGDVKEADPGKLGSKGGK
jgi:hypothetical protein